MSDGSWSLLVKGARGTFLLKILNVLLGFLSSIVLARILGVDEYGIYVYVLSWIWLLCVFTKMGFTELVVREVSGYANIEDWSLLGGFLEYSNWFVFLLSVSAIILYLLGAYYFFPDSFDPYLRRTFTIAVFLIPLISLTGLRQGALRALHKMTAGQFPEYVVKPAGIIILILGAGYLLQESPNAEIALYVNLSVSAVVLLLGYFILNRILPLPVKKGPYQYRRSEWTQSAFRFLLIAGMLVINNQTDKIMLGILGEVRDVGMYSVAAQMAGFSAFTLVALNTAISPLVVKLVADDNYPELQKIVFRSTRMALAGSLLIAVILFAVSDLLLGLFGDEFVKVKTVLVILLVGQLVNVAAGPAGTILNMTGNETVVAYVVAASAIINIVLNFVLIPRYGMEGAAIATACSMIVWNTTMVIVLFRKNRFSSSPLLRTGLESN